MWLIEIIRETVENHIPFDGNRLSPCEDITAKASLSNKLPSNVLTPDKIPDFFIPPKLSKDSGNSKQLPEKYKINHSASENSIQRCTKIPLLHLLSKQGIPDSDTQSSNESSPYSSPLLPQSLPGSSLLKMFGQESSLGESSRSTSKQSLGGNSSFSTDECSSADTSPSASKKAFFTVSALCCSLAPPVLFSLDLLQCQEHLQKEHLIQLHGRGMVRLSTEYDPGSATLRVRVVSVEDLYDSSFEEKCVHCCVIMCLTPGKMQRQQSTIIKNSRNPIFNKDFFFDEVTEEDLQSMSLKLKVLNKACNLKRDTVLGVNVMPLFQLLPL
ncbi:C2 calcium-dependent domain-containing protein 4C-like [Polyodon spathula]|uniref:C2 calcium-dependent domain-containing protein 4C-like n=1 Tax=Polyodon spathula TaxID=7913 RepID=UPI001B7E8C92|nr:C2 calcium-dependent domain-containing protein 4C-like [Polyodon spathula]